MNSEHIAQLRQYLATHVEIRNRHRESMISSNWVYDGLEDFVLKEGKVFWEVSPWQPERGKKNRYRPRFMKACFDNSYKAAVASRGKLRYIEGYAYNGFLPVHHAWNIDEEDRVIDTTWWGDGGLYDNPNIGTAYMGVEFPVPYVRSLRNPDNLCVLDQWKYNWPVLTTPYNELLEVAA